MIQKLQFTRKAREDHALYAKKNPLFLKRMADIPRQKHGLCGASIKTLRTIPVTNPKIQWIFLCEVKINATSASLRGIHLLTLTVPVIASLFAAFFFLLWTRRKTLRYLLWIGSAFLLFGTGLLSQILIIPRSMGLHTLLSCILYSAATLAFAEGVLRRLELRSTYWFNFSVAFLTLAGIALFYYCIPRLDVRVYILNFGLALILFTTAIKMRKTVLQPLDKALFWTILVFSLQMFVRTLLTVEKLPDVRDITQIRQYAATPFWIWMNVSFLIFTVFTGLLLSTVVASDIIATFRRKAVTDSLTALLNRRGLEEFAIELKSRAGLILLDLDDFKSINDIYGHHVGDMVLERVGSVLQKNIRTVDAAARMGGEEFAVILCSLSESNVYEVAERLRGQIAGIQFEERFLENLTVTASIGVVEFRSGEHFSHALRQADTLMYVAKRTGKNKIIVSQDAGAADDMQVPVIGYPSSLL